MKNRRTTPGRLCCGLAANRLWFPQYRAMISELLVIAVSRRTSRGPIDREVLSETGMTEKQMHTEVREPSLQETRS